MSDKFLSVTKRPKQTNKQTNKSSLFLEINWITTVILYEGKRISEQNKNVLFYLTKLFLNLIPKLLLFESMSKIIV